LDGNGYNQGKKGKNISLEARIIAAADTFDAMSHDRSYRKACPKEVIIEEFKHCTGKQLDPEIAKIVISMMEEDYLKIFNEMEIILAHFNNDEAII
jgi:energy-coupling factor transport system substrate-specific component